MCDMLGFPGGTSGKNPTCQCRNPKRCRFDPWVGKIRWRRAWQSTQIFLPREFHEKEMATHSRALAWRIPGTGGAWWAAVSGVAQSRTRLK